MRIDDIEFIRNFGDQRDAEIVKWEKNPAGKEFRCTLLWWRKGSNSFNVEFVDSRPFDYENTEKLFDLMHYGQKVLEAERRLLENWV